MAENLSPILSALEDPMPRLDPKAAAQYQHIHPLRSKTFVRPLAGAATLDAVTDFVAECYSNGVPANAVIGPEGSNLVARWAVPMEDYPRNR
jgi:hypothetical protein